MYNPSLHTVTNKSLGIAQPIPTDARSYFYDEGAFSYRPYANKAEVYTYLSAENQRKGQFAIFITEGSKINAYWFKNGYTDDDLERIDGVREISATSALSIATRAKELYETMIIIPNANVSGVTIGTTDGGNDIEYGRSMVAGTAYTYNLSQYFVSAGAFYFANLGTFDIILIKRDI